jgi:hypothetical protein
VNNSFKLKSITFGNAEQKHSIITSANFVDLEIYFSGFSIFEIVREPTRGCGSPNFTIV